MEDTSVLKLYSLGRASQNKEYGSNQLRIYPYEIRPVMDGETASQAQKVEVKGVDSVGNEYQDHIVSSTDIEATWLPIGEPNKMFAPDINRGGEVIIFRYADSNKYFWVPGGISPNNANRTAETAVWAFAAHNDPDAPIAPDGSNAYVLKVDPRNKSISIVTSIVNGEKTGFNMALDTASGTWQLTTLEGDAMLIDMVNKRVALLNSAKTMFELKGQHQNLKVPGNATDSIKGNWTVEVGGNALVKAGTATVQATEITLDGEVSCTKGLKVAGAVEVGLTVVSQGVMRAPQFIET
jgi:hypothetical protein